MEFLRFGSSIPGSYWGCCAVCIIQNFKVDPDAKASIELVSGDGGNPVTDSNRNVLFAGPTWKDIFLQRLRYGTFGKSDMPNHGFLAVLTEHQVRSNPGKKWMAILKEQGFEFIRAVDNSVYTGEGLHTPKSKRSSHPNYIFGLFRNVGAGAIDDPFAPPKEWAELPEAEGTEASRYKALPKGVFMTREQLEKDGVPVWLAGRRSDKPQQLSGHRKDDKPTAPAPFASKPSKAVKSAAEVPF